MEIPNALAKLESNPILKAGVCPRGILESKNPIDVKSGYPGGCGTPPTNAAVTKSPTSPSYTLLDKL